MKRRIVDEGNAARDRKERQAFLEFSICERVEAARFIKPAFITFQPSSTFFHPLATQLSRKRDRSNTRLSTRGGAVEKF